MSSWLPVTANARAAAAARDRAARAGRSPAETAVRRCQRGHPQVEANLHVNSFGLDSCLPCLLGRPAIPLHEHHALADAETATDTLAVVGPAHRARPGYRIPEISYQGLHPMTDTNTYIDARGYGACRRCRADAQAASA